MRRGVPFRGGGQPEHIGPGRAVQQGVVGNIPVPDALLHRFQREFQAFLACAGSAGCAVFCGAEDAGGEPSEPHPCQEASGGE